MLNLIGGAALRRETTDAVCSGGVAVAEHVVPAAASASSAAGRGSFSRAGRFLRLQRGRARAMIATMLERRYPDERCREILDYYFGEASHADCDLEAFRARTKLWFFPDADADNEIRMRFATAVARASSGELHAWQGSALGSLGLVLLLAQFPRNLNRDSALAFEDDAKALAITLAGLDKGFDAELTSGERLVFYLPVMHAEDLALQVRASQLYKDLAETGAEPLRPELAQAHKMAARHHEIIERFGRFPDRNKVLARESTPEELAFLLEPSASF